MEESLLMSVWHPVFNLGYVEVKIADRNVGTVQSDFSFFTSKSSVNKVTLLL